MVDYQYSSLFLKDSVDKQLNIVSDDGKINITNTELHQEKFELSESLCSDSELTFGACEAGMISFTVSNTFLPMKGKWLTVRMSLGGHTDASFQFGRYKVYSDTPTADRTCRDVVAYDALYDVITADVTSWYNSVFTAIKKQETQEDGTIKTTVVYDSVTMKQFRDSFFKHFGIMQADVSLVNDDMSVEKTIEVTESSDDGGTIGEAISGKEVLSCILEINGCMGHMGRDGKFHYVYLEQGIQGLYPRNDLYPADDLYPMEPKGVKIGKGFYISAQYEDFTVKTINKVQIREKENDIGATAGSGNNAYIIEDNFLAYGKGTEELTGIAKKVLSKIKGIVYRPFSADCKGNPCLEVGDAVRISTKFELIESYILKRTIKGIQALRDSIEADGEEYRTGNVNSVQRSIIQLKGKSNVLERSIEETKSTITNVEKGLQSQITQTASEIRTEVKNTADGLFSRITQNANSITAEVKRASEAEGNLSSSIKINAGNITAEVKRASEAEGNLSSSIKINADNIKLKVSKGSVSSEISQEAGLITIKSNRLVIQSDNFKLTKDGKITATDGMFSGKITATEGQIGAFTITGTKLYGTKDGKTVMINVPKTGTYVFAAGGSTHDSYSDCPFRVTYEGKMYATDAIVSGKVTATSGEIGGCKISGGVLKIKNANIEEINADKITSGTISTDRLDVSGIASANEFTAKYVKTENFTADYISALGITVSSANVTGGFNANKITSGTINADRINVSSIASRFTSSNNITVGGVTAESLVSKSLSISGGAALLGKTVEWKTATIAGVTIKYLGYKEN